MQSGVDPHRHGTRQLILQPRGVARIEGISGSLMLVVVVLISEGGPEHVELEMHGFWFDMRV
jgi:hypothetical protein